MWDALVKCWNTETAKMKGWVTILYGLNILMVSFCTNSKDTNLYLESIWWNAAKSVYVAARLFPFLGARRKVRRDRSEGIVVVLSWWEEMWVFGKFWERKFGRAFSLHIILVLFLKIRVRVRKNCVCLVVITFNSAALWSLRMDCSLWFFPLCGFLLNVARI